MKKTNRKAFTIVELVIVIAVISILAAVLIPTFSGIIKNANIAADEAEASSLTTQLNLDLDGIQSDDEIYEAIKKVYGDTVAENFAPRSAQYGYHYWYDIANNAVVLKTYDQIAPAPGEGGEGASIAQPSGVIAISTALVDEPTPAASSFEGKEHRTFVGYYLIDMGGVIGDALKALDTNTGVQDALSKLNEIASNEHDDNKSIAYAIVNLLGAVSKVTDFTISASGSDVVEGLNVAYASYHITNLKLSASGFITDTGAPTSKTVTWTSSNDNLATIDADGNVTVKTAILSDPNATVRFTATVDDYSEYVDVYFVYPRNLEFTLGGMEYDMIIGEDEHDVTITFDGSTHTFAFTDFVPYLNVSEETANVNCDYNVVVSTTVNSLFTISNNVLTLKELASYDGITQDFTVNVGTAITKTFTVSINDISAEPFEKNEPFANPEFLYVIGNGNSIPLRVFFNSEKPGDATLGIYDFARSIGNTNAPIGADPNLTATVNGETSATGEWAISASDWANTMIKFTGTGVAKIKLGEVEFVFEVVDGNNVVPNATGNTIISSPAAGTNVILLSNVYISSGSKYNLTNSTLFGNGFTFDVSAGNYSANENTYSSDNYVVKLSGGTLNNVKVIGKNFDNFSAVRTGANNICNVFSTGNDIIANSYISGCASPVRLTNGNLEIINSTLSGGSFANLDIRSGSVVLDNVTTINQQSVAGQPASEGKLGFGVAVWYEQVSSCNITIKNDLKQYNYVTEAEVAAVSFEGSSVLDGSDVKDAVFANTEYVYTDGNGTKWINLGIISLTDEVDSNDLNFTSFNGKENYQAKTVSFTMNLGLTSVTKNGFFYAQKGSVANLQNPGEFDSEAQYYFKPSYSINIGDNKQDITDGSNVYCVMDGEEVNISFDQGGSKTFNFTNFMSASKYGKGLELTDVYLDGVNVTANGSVIFNAEGTYTLKFVFNDIYNYNTDGTVNKVQFEKSVTVNVNVVLPSAKNAEFDFNGNGYKKVVIGDDIYIMPNVSATSSTIASKTISGQTIYYPIINCKASNGKTTQTSGTSWYMLFPVFDGVITITDYANQGTGSAVTYGASTTTLPAGLAAVNPSTKFQYAAASTAPTTPSVFSNKLYYTSPQMEGVNRDSYTIDAEYTYTDNKGTTYHYFVQYITPKITNSACVTGDTLVTLADGTQVRVDSLTGNEMLLVWDHTKGALSTAPIAYIVNHDETISEHNVLSIVFSDGSNVDIIGEHVFYDKTLNKYITITSDNVNEYIGHTFVSNDGNGLKEVTLTGANEGVRNTGVYEVVTYKNITCFTNGVLSASAYLDPILNVFDINEDTLAYDLDQMMADIEKYGLYTYEDFEGLVPVEAFEMYNAAYLKVAVGKGYITWNDILALIDIYYNNDVTPIQ